MNRNGSLCLAAVLGMMAMPPPVSAGDTKPPPVTTDIRHVGRLSGAQVFAEAGVALGEHPSQFEFAPPDFTTFNSSLAVEASGTDDDNGTTYLGRGQGSQITSLVVDGAGNLRSISSSASLSGHASATGTSLGAEGAGLAQLSLFLQVDSPVAYSLSGSLVTTAPGESRPRSSAGARFSLNNLGTGGPFPVVSQIAGDSFGPGPSSAALGGSGVLAPGQYSLDIQGNALTDTNHVISVIQRSATWSFTLSFSPVDVDGDADGDGLLDSWETNGIDVDDDGDIDLDLPAMGAHPLRKDIFVEVDRMSPLSFSPAAADIVIDAFASAPVRNLDGSSGITMHIDNGPSSLMNPLTGTSWGGLSRGNAVPFISILGTSDPSGDYIWTAFDAIKADHFAAERRPAFHYVIIGDRFGSGDETASGISRDTVASDFLVTLGSAAVTGGTAFEQAGTFMHELGHNLGLRHGHGDGSDLHNQPNFLSIMNYAFQHTGLFHNGNVGLFDYSRFGLESLGQLDENALSELNGIQAVPSMSSYQTVHYCAAGGSFQLVNVVGPIDWNCVKGTNPGTVVEDINDDGIQTTLDPFNDWSNLVYRGGLIGGLGAGAALPDVTPVIEPSLSEILETTRVLAPFDLYLDGRIDLRDFALFQECFASKAGGAGGRCLAADFDADGVIDGTDHGPLANALTGP